MKKQNLTRAFLMAALLVGVFVAAGIDVDAQSGGMLGSGTRSSVMGSGGRDDGQVLGSGTFTGDGGGMIGSGTATIEDDGGLIGSGTRSQTVGSGGRSQSFFDTMLKFFGF